MKEVVSDTVRRREAGKEYIPASLPHQMPEDLSVCANAVQHPLCKVSERARIRVRLVTVANRMRAELGSDLVQQVAGVGGPLGLGRVGAPVRQLKAVDFFRLTANFGTSTTPTRTPASLKKSQNGGRLMASSITCRKPIDSASDWT